MIDFPLFAHRGFLFLLWALLLAALAGCVYTPAPAAQTRVVESTRTPVVIRVPVSTGAPASSAVPTVVVTPTSPARPGAGPTDVAGSAAVLQAASVHPPALFHTRELRAGVRPETYVDDVCEYLRRRWDPANSSPGTIIVPIMYHTIGWKNRSRANTFTPAPYFRRTISEAKRLGFETITAEQAADFIEGNARIPEHSLMLILDDRRLETAEKYLIPTAEANDWTITLAWNISDTGSRHGLWERVEGWYATGRVDAQSHGLRHYYMTRRSPEKKIREEIFGPIPVYEKHFGRRPIAFIWPGGLFTKKTARVAREADYRLAFTIFPRGPIMYNWIPQGPEERKIGDPVMTLPRYWGYPGMIEALQTAAAIGDAARQEALRRYPEEASYYRQRCGAELTPPPNLQAR